MSEAFQHLEEKGQFLRRDYVIMLLLIFNFSTLFTASLPQLWPDILQLLQRQHDATCLLCKAGPSVRHLPYYAAAALLSRHLDFICPLLLFCDMRPPSVFTLQFFLILEMFWCVFSLERSISRLYELKNLDYSLSNCDPLVNPLLVIACLPTCLVIIANLNQNL